MKNPPSTRKNKNTSKHSGVSNTDSSSEHKEASVLDRLKEQIKKIKQIKEKR